MAGFALSSPALPPGEDVPRKFTADGQDLSPLLEWTEPPAGTKSFALIVDDPDAPAGTWVHWVLTGIPSGTRKLPEGIDARPKPDGLGGATNGKNNFGKLGYGGPSPPPGKPHRYYFKLYALDTMVETAPGASKADAVAAMKGHILAEAELMRTYRR
jgi:Raf kinase inhibitor-like YbhB/YbcL family protein